jgi:histidinol-phosphatase (PHP family)
VSDYHLHLHEHGAGDPDGPPMGEYPPGHIERYVEAALERGVTEIGFTEHLYRCVESVSVLGEWWRDDERPDLAASLEAWLASERTLSLHRYVEAVLDAKERGLPVKLGLEVDFVPGTEAAVLDLLAPIPFDYLVGSVHWVGAWNFMRDTAPEEFARRGVETAFEQYFALEAALAASGMVDVLGHADVVKRHRLVPDGSLDALYRPVVEAAARTGTAVEISSAGLRYPVGQTFPSPDFLAHFRAAGVPITLASDGHVPDEAGWGHDAVVGVARAAGYSEYLRFTTRRREPTPLPDVSPSPGPAP